MKDWIGWYWIVNGALLAGVGSWTVYAWWWFLEELGEGVSRLPMGFDAWFVWVIALIGILTENRDSEARRCHPYV